MAVLAFIRCTSISFFLVAEINAYDMWFGFWAPSITYFTGWGWYLWGLYNLFSLYLYVRHGLGKDPLPASNFREKSTEMWKVTTFLFETATVYQVIITSFFWLAIFPYYPFPMYFCDYAKHGVPMVFLTIELVINRIAFEWRHVAVSLITAFCYIILYITFCLVKGRDVYPFLLLNSWVTYAFFAGVLATITALHALFYGITLLKFKRNYGTRPSPFEMVQSSVQLSRDHLGA